MDQSLMETKQNLNIHINVPLYNHMSMHKILYCAEIAILNTKLVRSQCTSRRQKQTTAFRRQFYLEREHNFWRKNITSQAEIIIRNNIRKATWNMLTNKIENVVFEMKRHKINILGMSKTLWKEGSCARKDNGFELSCTSWNESKHGIGWKEGKSIEWNILLNESIVMLIVLVKHFDINIMQV